MHGPSSLWWRRSNSTLDDTERCLTTYDADLKVDPSDDATVALPKTVWEQLADWVKPVSLPLPSFESVTAGVPVQRLEDLLRGVGHDVALALSDVRAWQTPGSEFGDPSCQAAAGGGHVPGGPP